jgi:hypothetical protein
MAARQRQLIVGAVALGLVTFAVWRFSGNQARTPPKTIASGGGAETVATAPKRSEAGTTLPTVTMDLLDVRRPEPTEGGRDLFRFGTRREQPEADDQASGPGGRRAAASAAQRSGPGVGADPSAPAPPPPIPLKFIGVVRQQSGSTVIAVLSDSGGVYYGREGDVIEGRYRIIRISDEVIEMTYVDGRGRQTIRLSGA